MALTQSTVAWLHPRAEANANTNAMHVEMIKNSRPSEGDGHILGVHQALTYLFTSAKEGEWEAHVHRKQCVISNTHNAPMGGKLAGSLGHHLAARVPRSPKLLGYHSAAPGPRSPRLLGHRTPGPGPPFHSRLSNSP